jgi:hypothetical protein
VALIGASASGTNRDGVGVGAVLEATLEEVPRAATVAPKALTVEAISGLVALIEAANASRVVVVTALEATLAKASMVAMKVLEAALGVEAEIRLQWRNVGRELCRAATSTKWSAKDRGHVEKRCRTCSNCRTCRKEPRERGKGVPNVWTQKQDDQV